MARLSRVDGRLKTGGGGGGERGRGNLEDSAGREEGEFAEDGRRLRGGGGRG